MPGIRGVGPLHRSANRSGQLHLEPGGGDGPSNAVQDRLAPFEDQHGGQTRVWPHFRSLYRVLLLRVPGPASGRPSSDLLCCHGNAECSRHARDGVDLSIIYLSCLHLHRQIYDYGSYGLDITGPLMVITQKATSLAFSLHDGLTKNEEEMTELQRNHAVFKAPSFLEYFSYSLLFPSLMAGPVLFYNDYIDFIEGKSYAKHCSSSNLKAVVVQEPSPVISICKKVIVALFCAYIFLSLLPKFPIRRAKDEHFLENTSLSYKFWYLTVSTTLVRFKYYFAWTLADAICNNCGIGFNGYNEDGSPNWDGISNVDILQFELATSLKQAIEAWIKVQIFG
nr:unnamed protein product [Callosobruchus analis]